LIAALLLVTTGFSYALAQRTPVSIPGKEAILSAEDVSKVFPQEIFFGGRLAEVQLGNSAGVHYRDESLVLAALIDNSVFTIWPKEKYQGYLINDIAVQIGTHTLYPGAYGFGFVEGNKFVVMDIGGGTIFETNSSPDATLHDPMPLQILRSATGTYRLYKSRDFVEFKGVKMIRIIREK
jgi:hypothetical protein